MKRCVISLARTPHRLERFKEHNRFLNHFAVYPAQDGSKLSRSSLINAGYIGSGLAYTNGALGCAMSHIKLWEEATDHGLTIFEDDAIINPQLNNLETLIKNNLPEDWDFVAWGWNFNSPALIDLMPGVSLTQIIFDESNLYASVKTFQESRQQPKFYPLKYCFGTPAYSISACGARKLLSTLPLYNFDLTTPTLTISNQGIDTALIKAYPHIKAFICLPPLAITLNDKSTSTVNP